MIRHAFVGAALAIVLAVPATALEHEVVIDHSSGAIAADYKGSVTIATKQVGAAGPAGRPSTLRCQWTASLNVERVAQLGVALQSRRTLTSDDVATGSRPGWCPSDPQAVDRLVDVRDQAFRTAMLALVERDRAALVAEADTAATRG
jgi:hypothetical protein